MVAVLDASALLAFLRGEDGAERVSAALEAGCAISTVNLAEVLSRLADLGIDPAVARSEIAAIGDALEPIAFSEDDSIEVARLRPLVRAAGLSLADRSCLALAKRFDLAAWTADRAWTIVPESQIRVELIR